jgi:hypothetical protein
MDTASSMLLLLLLLLLLLPLHLYITVTFVLLLFNVVYLFTSLDVHIPETPTGIVLIHLQQYIGH